MKKRILSVLLSLTMCLGVITFPSTVNAEQPIKVKLNDKTLNFEAQPQIIDDCTMVPMRSIFENLGYYVEWLPEDECVCAIDMNTYNCIVMYIGEEELYSANYYEFMNSSEPAEFLKEHTISLEVSAQIINDNTLVPVRAVSEVSGYDVEWDSSNRTVLIYDPVYKKNLTDKKSSMIKTEYNKILSLYNPQNDTYAVYDIDKDNIPELIVKTGTCEVDYKYIYYSYCNNSATKIGEHSGMHTSLMTYPDGNGIVKEWMHQGCGALYLVSYESGVLNERELIPEGFVSTYDVSLDAFLPNSSFIDMYPVNANAHLSDIDTYFVNKNNIKGENASNSVAYDNVIEEIKYISQLAKDGLYLEVIEMCDHILSQYNLSASDKSVIESMKEVAVMNYESYLKVSNYYNATNEINQIKQFISNGLYLEAIQMCEETIAWHTLSPLDIAVINNLKEQAQKKYNEYLAQQDNSNHTVDYTPNYYDTDWIRDSMRSNFEHNVRMLREGGLGGLRFW